MELSRMISEEGIRVILASGSPRRTELLHLAGIRHEVVLSGADESIQEKDPEKLVQMLSGIKAEDVARKVFGDSIGQEAGMQKGGRQSAREDCQGGGGQSVHAAGVRNGGGQSVHAAGVRNGGGQSVQAAGGQKGGGQSAREGRGGWIVIGADTVVSKDGKILGKPKNAADAAAMLHFLSGSAHQVYTGVTILAHPASGVGQGDAGFGSLHTVGNEWEVRTFSERSDVHVVSMDDDEIGAYIATGEPMDKAGAYGIQGGFGRYISRIEGDYYNIVGLPICRLCSELKRVLIELH